LQVRQLGRHILPDQIRPRAQHLTELDERGAQFAQREPDADGRAEIHDALACRPAQPLLHALAGHLAKVIGEAVSNGDAGDLPEPMRIAPASAASFQTFTYGGQVHDSHADPQKAFHGGCRMKPSIPCLEDRLARRNQGTRPVAVSTRRRTRADERRNRLETGKSTCGCAVALP
jgi:hypothetical protein